MASEIGVEIVKGVAAVAVAAVAAFGGYQAGLKKPTEIPDPPQVIANQMEPSPPSIIPDSVPDNAPLKARLAAANAKIATVQSTAWYNPLPAEASAAQCVTQMSKQLKDSQYGIQYSTENTVVFRDGENQILLWCVEDKDMIISIISGFSAQSTEASREIAKNIMMGAYP
ncbi:hypothetical protein ACFB49_38470 [Sphingomonas sp. DBB INV C78]|uniref:hypothetical protein n=1 Tax=Sphingomonas sp. DBB INV C78 TaxID=3349434 RepID=UPI0036D3B007